MINLNRQTDLLNFSRNSFGLDFPNNIVSLGTKGDVETFFLVLNDLILDGSVEDCYKTISHDLYRTLVNKDNLLSFEKEVKNLEQEFAKIRSEQISWERYPFNREFGQFDYQERRIDPSKLTLSGVFERFFSAFKRVGYWINIANSENYKTSRLIIAPTEIRTGRKFKNFSDEQFLQSAEDPLWLREPG